MRGLIVTYLAGQEAKRESAFEEKNRMSLEREADPHIQIQVVLDT